MNVKEEEPKCIPPIFIAAIVQSLLESGHDANERCALGTVLQTAATQGHDILLRNLLEKGADPNLLAETMIRHWRGLESSDRLWR